MNTMGYCEETSKTMEIAIKLLVQEFRAACRFLGGSDMMGINPDEPGIQSICLGAAIALFFSHLPDMIILGWSWTALMDS